MTGLAWVHQNMHTSWAVVPAACESCTARVHHEVGKSIDTIGRLGVCDSPAAKTCRSQPEPGVILAVFQRGDLEIPDHRPLIDDLHSMERTITVAGNVRYAAPREAGSHADRWTALALALPAAGPAPPERFEIIFPTGLSRREQMRRM